MSPLRLKSYRSPQVMPKGAAAKENALPCSSAGSPSRTQVENLKANSLSVQPLFTSLEMGWTALLAQEEREKSVEATGTAVFGSTPTAFMQ